LTFASGATSDISAAWILDKVGPAICEHTRGVCVRFSITTTKWRLSEGIRLRWGRCRWHPCCQLPYRSGPARHPLEHNAIHMLRTCYRYDNRTVVPCCWWIRYLRKQYPSAAISQSVATTRGIATIVGGTIEFQVCDNSNAVLQNNVKFRQHM
jgi:hypothetical protein